MGPILLVRLQSAILCLTQSLVKSSQLHGGCSPAPLPATVMGVQTASSAPQVALSALESAPMEPWPYRS